MKLKAEDTAALIVDFQDRLMPVIKDSEEIIKNACILIKGLKVLGVPVIVTQQYTKGIGNTVPEVAEALGEYTYMEKSTFSSWENEDIREKLYELGKKNLLVCGAEAHICVLQTALDLKTAGYETVFITDCSGSRKDKDKNCAIDRCKHEGIITATYETILMELCGKAGDDKFRAISKLIK